MFSLGEALIVVFCITLLGFLMGRFDIIQPGNCVGMGQFLGLVALPALLFRAMATLDWSTVEWDFLIAVIVSKTVMFTLAAVLTVFSEPKRDKAGVAKAGLYGLFVTQSNDFALGLPIIKGVFGETHPEYLKFFYLTGPCQVAWINPIAFLMIEYGLSKGKTVSSLPSEQSDPSLYIP
jgi:predicted permease